MLGEKLVLGRKAIATEPNSAKLKLRLASVLDESDEFNESIKTLNALAAETALPRLTQPEPDCEVACPLQRGEAAMTGTKDDEFFMREAITVATGKGTDPSLSPIGCVIVLDGKVIAAARNRVAEDHDATAHAEIVAMREAGKAFENGEIRGATLYSTLQPCGMCTMASIWSKAGRIVFGAGRDDVHRMYFEARHVDTLDFIRDAYRDDLQFEGGVLRDECARLYYGPDDDPPEREQGNI